MGRVIGDGGWYFHIIDMAVLPEHQHRGLGNAILTWLLDRIRSQGLLVAIDDYPSTGSDLTRIRSSSMTTIEPAARASAMARRLASTRDA